MKREREERYGTKCGNREDTATVRRLESEKKDTVKRTKSKESTASSRGCDTLFEHLLEQLS